MSINSYFIEKVKGNFEFNPTSQQDQALSQIVDFLFAREEENIFLLTGYAGTGKSSLVGTLVKTMSQLQQKTILLAPTGRAAKVFALYANHPAFTIHKKIYRQQKFTGDTANFSIMDNLHKDTIFIVDEASMISNNSFGNFNFGTGCLLDDLIQYVYSGENCKLILIGDSAQLPPVGSEESPALQENMLSGYGLQVFSTNLAEVVRQTKGSGIIINATNLRNALLKQKTDLFPKIKFKGFDDIRSISGEDLIDEISSAYSKDGIDSTMIITRSNKRANIYNQGIRNTILYKEEELSTGDFLMIARNNYHWSENVENMDFLANGEIVQVRRVRNHQELYGFRFCDVELRNLDTDIEFEAKILLDTLHSESASLDTNQQESLFQNIISDYEHISGKANKMKELKKDPFYNALQVKFAYAITCHKAQGGEWMNIFIDIGYITEEHLGISFYRWLYTAITRASHKVFFVNLPKEFM